MGESSNVRTVFTGSLYSVQVYSLARAPASGWYEVAAFDEEAAATWLERSVLVADCGITVDGAEVIGLALSKARSVAHENGIATGIARERKRKEGRDG